MNAKEGGEKAIYKRNTVDPVQAIITAWDDAVEKANDLDKLEGTLKEWAGKFTPAEKLYNAYDGLAKTQKDEAKKLKTAEEDYDKELAEFTKKAVAFAEALIARDKAREDAENGEE